MLLREKFSKLRANLSICWKTSYFLSRQRFTLPSKRDCFSLRLWSNLMSINLESQKWNVKTKFINRDNSPHSGKMSRCYAEWVVKQRGWAQSFNLHLIEMKWTLSFVFYRTIWETREASKPQKWLYSQIRCEKQKFWWKKRLQMSIISDGSSHVFSLNGEQNATMWN